MTSYPVLVSAILITRFPLCQDADGQKKHFISHQKKKKSRKKSQQQICYNQDNSLALGTTFGKSQSRTPFDVPTVAIMCSKKGGRVMDIRALCGISIDLCILHNSCFSDKLHQVIVGPAITSSLDSQQL